MNNKDSEEIHRVSSNFNMKDSEDEEEHNPFNIGDMLNKIKSSVSRNTQIVEGNSSVVTPSMFSEVDTFDSITQKHLDSTKYKHDNLITSTSNDLHLRDYWDSDTNKIEIKNPLKESFLDIFIPEVLNLTKVSSTKEYVNAVLNIVSVLEDAPMILNYVIENKDSLTVFINEGHGKIASNLLAKLLINLES